MRIFVITLLALFILAGAIPARLSGQDRNEEVTIIAPYQPTITDPVKTNMYPTFPDIEKREQEFDYQAIDRKVDTEIEITPIQPRRPSGDRRKKLYRNYLKAGIGSYLSPYFLFSASSLQNNKSSYTARAEHLSSNGGIKDYPANNFSRTDISFSGARYFKKSTLLGEIGYNRNMVHWYGFLPDSFPNMEFEKDDIRQRFQTFHGELSLTGGQGKRDKFHYDLGIGLHYLDDRYESRETGAKLDFDLAGDMDWFSFTDQELLGIEGSVFFTGNSDSIHSGSRLLVQAMPYYELSFDQYRVKIGINTAYNKGDSVSTLSIYPYLRGEVLVVDNRLAIYAGIRGKTSPNTLRTFSGENPFISSIQGYRHTNETFEIFGGLKGSVASFSLFAEASYMNTEDMPLYVTDTSTVFKNQFLIIYDDVQVFHLGLGAGTHIIDKLYVRLKGDFYSYSPDRESFAWQRPSVLGTFEVSYDVIEKLNLNAGIYYIGQRKAKNFSNSGGEFNLDPGFDLNVGAEYQILERFSAFLKATNLLNSGYQKWYNYPVQGIQVMGGITYIF